MNKITAAVVLSLGVNSGVGFMVYGQGVSFEHKDWQVICDNTRTCRAAGYSPEDADNRVTILLTRKAGVGQEVSARIKFSEMSNDDSKNVENPDKVILKIGGKFYGEIGSVSLKKTTNDYGSNSLSETQTKALLLAMKGTSKISFIGGNKEWILPGDGAAAVLLKMDDVQGRVGTPSALSKKGTKSEDSVLPALPKPIVYQKPLPKENVTSWQYKINWDILKKELPSDKKLIDDNYCRLLTEGDSDYNKFDPKVIAVLPHDHLLISGLCWQGAYNEGYGYWVINQHQPYQPQLVTTMADSSLFNNEIISTMKGRGIGDCWSRKSWIWNGESFVETYDGDSGMCRMIAAGGAWDLPTYIATVK